jgi:hypothetical protein
MRRMDQTTLTALATYPDLLEAHYAAIPTAFATWAPSSWDGIPSEPFTALEQLCHVRDIEIDGYHARLRATLVEERPVLPAIDGELLAQERAYAQADPAVVMRAFRAARTQTLQILQGLEAVQWRRTAVFAEHGVVTLSALVHLLCSHDQQHLAGLQWLRARMDALQAGCSE